MSLCFAPLLKWVLTWWRSDRLALVIDPTLKGDDTAAIVISVLYRGRAKPREWRILRAKRPGSWMDPIVELLQALAPAAPGEMTVIVLCDRGLNSPKLWRQIRAQSLPRTGYGGWHPYVRYPKNITFCAEGGQRLPARSFVSRPDTAWIGSGTAFRGAAKRRCTLLVVWCADQPEPWIILTDQPPEAVGVSWYGLRFWPRAKHGVTLSNWASKPAPYWIRGPSRAWAGNGTRPVALPARASPAIGSCCPSRRCWPWPTAPEWRMPRNGSWLPAISEPRPGRHLPNTRLPLPSAGKARQRNPLRHRLAATVAPPGPALASGLAAARTLAGTPIPISRSSAMPLLEQPFTYPCQVSSTGQTLLILLQKRGLINQTI